jgi:hypothetical protein
VELLVSEYISGLLVGVLDVPGEASKHNDRAYIEQNLIALASNVYRPMDVPSCSWLGLHSRKYEIRRSGLWNVNHTAQSFDSNLLSMLNYYVRRTLGEPELGPKPNIPPEWAANVRRDTKQLSLI